MCACGIATGPADIPGRFRCRPAGGDHQGIGHADAGTDSGNEPELYRVQVPADQESSLAEGKLKWVAGGVVIDAVERRGGTGRARLCIQVAFVIVNPRRFFLSMIRDFNLY